MILTTFSRSAKAFLLIAFFLLSSCMDTEPEQILIEGRTMGTTYSVKVIGEVERDALALALEQRLLEVNQLMSTYIRDSEISRINQMKLGESMEVSAENLQMLDLAKRLTAESNNKFDVTLGPLIALWGFGADPNRNDVPSAEAIAAAKDQMGLDGLNIQGGRIEKRRNVAIDFSAIAKGFGVDELARVAEQHGAKNYLVEIGGELRAKGQNRQGRTWRVGIETPDSVTRTVFAAVPLKDVAMATSGDYRNYFEVDGQRFSHTLDPNTGFPITHNVASVTVLAPTTAEADGYATAINVMGAESGLALAEKINLPVLVIMKVNGEFESRTSSAFDKYLAKQNSQ